MKMLLLPALMPTLSSLVPCFFTLASDSDSGANLAAKELVMCLYFPVSVVRNT